MLLKMKDKSKLYIIIEVIVLLFIFILLAAVFAPMIFLGHRPVYFLIIPVICFVAAFLVLNTLRRVWKGKSRKEKIIRRTLAGVILTGITFVAVLVTVMLSASFSDPPAQGDATVVVLGCKVNGSSPSLMLSKRIRAAYDYLSENEDAVCIVTGGQGEDENIPEAQAQKNKLIAMGIDESRIYLEDRSTNTYENIHNAGEIIEEHGLSSNVVIATDTFHQLRSHIIASREGLEPSSVSANTPWYLEPYYWAREILAVIQTVVFP